MAEYTDTLVIAVSPALKAAIIEKAARERRPFSALARVTLERVFLANEITLEQCNKLIDPGVSYDTEPA